MGTFLDNANIMTAFLAGLLSFFSPCTLPLVPLFLGHLAGVGGDELAVVSTKNRGLLLRNAGAFVLGFSLVFILVFGLPAGLLAGTLQEYRTILMRIGGLFLIVLGLNYLGLIRIAPLLREWRLHYRPTRRDHLPTSLLVGATFALGWTPCIGAILGAITTMALIGQDAGGAVILLVAYSLGLGVPFMIVAAGFGRVMPLLRRAVPYLPVFNRLAGGLIVVVGVFMLVGAYQSFFVHLIRISGWRPPL
ncbi:MAG TPA: cytochrome c biogenesis CcdA family protein [Thermomicrobiales bacterium]